MAAKFWEQLSGKTEGSKDADVDLEKRKTLAGAAALGAGSVFGGAPAAGVAGKALLESSAATAVIKGILNTSMAEGAGKVLKEFDGALGVLLRQMTSFGQEVLPATPDGKDPSEWFRAMHSQWETGMEFLLGKELPTDFQTLNTALGRLEGNTHGMSFAGLPKDLTLNDILGDQIRSAYESAGIPNALPAEKFRTELIGQVKRITGLDKDATFGQIREAYRDKVAQFADRVFDNMDSLHFDNPYEEENILNQLHHMTETWDDRTPPEHRKKIMDRISEKYRRVQKQNHEDFYRKMHEAEVEKSEKSKEALSERRKLYCHVREVATTNEPYSARVFNVTFDLKEGGGIRDLLQADVLNLLRVSNPNITPGMFDVQVVYGGARVISDDPQVIDILRGLTHKKEKILFPDRVNGQPLRLPLKP